MKIIDELEYDFCFSRPKVIATGSMVILENVAEVKMITGEAVTIGNGEKYVTVVGSDFVIKEIQERRLIIEGRVQRVEFL